MTRRGSPEEQDWRRKRQDDPGLDGSLHGPMPVPPRGRTPREKPEGHRHKEKQPPQDHGASHDAGGADENPHVNATTNPHAVTHSQTSPPTTNPHQVTHSQVGAPTGNPHAVTATEAGAVANTVASPSRRRENRADQPLPGDVPVGTADAIADEADIVEVATDTDGDGVADQWRQRSTRGVVPTQYVTAADSRDRNIDNSDFQADGTSDHVTIQNAVDSLPVGTK